MTLRYKKVIIAGTPGVGKTSVAKALSVKINGLHLDLSEIALSKNMISYYDELRESYVIDENRLIQEILETLSKVEVVIIDTHYPEIVPNNVIDAVFIIRLHPSILYERLLNKKWSLRKVKENVLAEALSIVALNALEHFGVEKIFEIDSTGMSIEEVASTILDVMEGKRVVEKGVRIDWLEKISLDELDKFSELGLNEEY